MTARFDRAWAKASRVNIATSVGFLLAAPGTAIRLRRESLTEACRAVYER